MISTNDFKTGVTVEIDGDAWQVVEFQHVKPGKGAAFVRAKMRNLCTGAVVERTFTPLNVSRMLRSFAVKCSTSMKMMACMSSWTMKPTNRLSLTKINWAAL